MGAKVRRHSRIEKELPEELRAEVNRFLIEGLTYEEISDYLKEKGYDISRSSVGRYGRDFLEYVRRIRMVEDKADELVSAAGDGLTLEEAASKMLLERVMAALIDGQVTQKQLSFVIGAVAQLQSSSVRREKFKAEIHEKADRAVSNIEKKVGGQLSEETLTRIKEEIYGITK